MNIQYITETIEETDWDVLNLKEEERVVRK